VAGFPDGLRPKIPIWVYFMDIWSILRPFEIFYRHLVNLVVIWYNFSSFSLLVCCSKKNLANPGTDVMITIFCDFFTILGEQIGVFLKNQCYDQFF
jgi:hypothetical protein